MSEDALKIAEIAAEIWRLKYLKAEDDLAKAVLKAAMHLSTHAEVVTLQ